ncbi:MAG: Hsp20 family protein [Parvibaculaceae bacterium]|nr:Hsp20 family protein [Parvibaculaceae bacterium]
MSRLVQFNNPFVLGFEEMERLIDRVAKGSEGYPPYNVERVAAASGDVLRITLAVAGFPRASLTVTLEGNQLVVRGRQQEDESPRAFLHRGIAARAFERAFVLAEGIRISEAKLVNGLLSIDLIIPEPAHTARQINIIEEPE